jgi:hypothetical protein
MVQILLSRMGTLSTFAISDLSGFTPAPRMTVLAGFKGHRLVLERPVAGRELFIHAHFASNDIELGKAPSINHS